MQFDFFKFTVLDLVKGKQAKISGLNVWFLLFRTELRISFSSNIS